MYTWKNLQARSSIPKNTESIIKIRIYTPRFACSYGLLCDTKYIRCYNRC